MKKNENERMEETFYATEGGKGGERKKKEEEERKKKRETKRRGKKEVKVNGKELGVDEILMEEVERQIRRLKNKKAPEGDTAQNEA